MKTLMFLCIMLATSLPAIAVNTLTEDFDGPTMVSPGFNVVTPGAFDGSGHYVMTETDHIYRHVDSGDFIMQLTYNAIDMGNPTAGYNVWYYLINHKGNNNENLLVLFFKDNTKLQFAVDKNIGGASTREYTENLTSLSSAVIQVAWDETALSYTVSLSLNGGPIIEKVVVNTGFTASDFNRHEYIYGARTDSEVGKPEFSLDRYVMTAGTTPAGQIESFDDFVTTGWQIPAEIDPWRVIQDPNGVKIEGTGSMRIDFSGSPFPWDIVPFRYQTYKIDPNSKALTFWEKSSLDGDQRVNQLILIDGDGHVARFTCPALGTTDWTKVTCPLSDFVVDNKLSFNYSSILAMQIWCTSWDDQGTYLWIDDLQLEEYTAIVPPYQIDSFDNYAATGWDDERNSGYMVQSPPGEFIEGTGALRIKFEDFDGTYDEVATKIFAPNLDFSDYENLSLSFWVWGDMVNDSRLHQIILYDKAFKIGRYTVPPSLSAGWRQIYAPLADFVWDGGQIPDWSTIQRIDFWFSSYPKPGNSVYLDDLWLIERPSLPGQQFLINAAKATIIVDGDAADWTGLESDIVEFDLTQVPNQPKGNLHVQYRLAWDNDYLYMLVEELPGDTLATEAPGLDWLDDGQGGDIRYDSLSLYFDFTNNSIPGSAEGIDLWLCLGFKTTDANDLMMAWTNGEWGPHKPDAVTHGAVFSTSPYTDPNEALGHRIIEAKVKWSDLDAHIEAVRLPAGGLLAAVRPGYIFGCDPRLNDLEGTNDWDSPTTEIGAAWLNGNLWANLPSGRDPFSIDVRLICSPGDLDGDCAVDLEDFAILSNEWQRTECSDLNIYCSSADIVIDGSVNLSDLAEFVRVWLSSI